MKNNSLDDIINCGIDISSPASSDATFDSIVLIVPAPEATGTKEMTKTTVISKADELLEYGFTTEDAAYKAANVAFSQNPAPDTLYICIRKSTVTEGEESERVYEPVEDTLTRAETEANFYGIHLTDFKDPEDVQKVVAWTEKHDKLFAFEYTDIDNCPVQNQTYYRSFGLFSGLADGYEDGEQPSDNEYAALAWMAKCFGYDPGSETWDLKELKLIIPSTLSSEQKKELKVNKINTFLRYAGNNVAIGGYTLAGEWIDVIRFRDWLKNEMQVSVFNAIKNNRKVPFTDGGIGMLEGKMEAVLKNGQDIGGIAPTEYDENDNEISGYTVTVPKASDLTEEQRKSRKLTGCKWTARLAGAIHVVEIKGNLTF